MNYGWELITIFEYFFDTQTIDYDFNRQFTNSFLKISFLDIVMFSFFILFLDLIVWYTVWNHYNGSNSISWHEKTSFIHIHQRRKCYVATRWMSDFFVQNHETVLAVCCKCPSKFWSGHWDAWTSSFCEAGIVVHITVW